MYMIRVKFRTGVDEYTTDDKAEADRIIDTAVGFGRYVMAWKDGKKIFDNVNA